MFPVTTSAPRSLLVFCAFLVGACAAPRTTRHTFGGDGGEAPLLEVTVHTLPGCPVRVPRKTNATGRMTTEGLVNVQLSASNSSSSPKQFRYSWQWIGPDRMSTTDPARQVWRTAFVDPKDSVTLTSTSTVADPSAVVLRLAPTNKPR